MKPEEKAVLDEYIEQTWLDTNRITRGAAIRYLAKQEVSVNEWVPFVAPQ